MAGGAFGGEGRAPKTGGAVLDGYGDEQGSSRSFRNFGRQRTRTADFRPVCPALRLRVSR